MLDDGASGPIIGLLEFLRVQMSLLRVERGHSLHALAVRLLRLLEALMSQPVMHGGLGTEVLVVRVLVRLVRSRLPHGIVSTPQPLLKHQ